jgi:hypothetical protein
MDLEMLYFFLACFGFASLMKVMVRDTVLDKKPFSCPLCMSFWAGVIFFLSRRYFLSSEIYREVIIIFAASGAAYCLNRFVTGEY